MFETLAHEGVNIDMISTSEIKISVVIDLAKGEAGDESRSRGVYWLMPPHSALPPAAERRHEKMRILRKAIRRRCRGLSA